MAWFKTYRENYINNSVLFGYFSKRNEIRTSLIEKFVYAPIQKRISSPIVAIMFYVIKALFYIPLAILNDLIVAPFFSIFSSTRPKVSLDPAPVPTPAKIDDVKPDELDDEDIFETPYDVNPDDVNPDDVKPEGLDDEDIFETPLDGPLEVPASNNEGVLAIWYPPLSKGLLPEPSLTAKVFLAAVTIIPTSIALANDYIAQPVVNFYSNVRGPAALANDYITKPVANAYNALISSPRLEAMKIWGQRNIMPSSMLSQKEKAFLSVMLAINRYAKRIDSDTDGEVIYEMPSDWPEEDLLGWKEGMSVVDSMKLFWRQKTMPAPLLSKEQFLLMKQVIKGWDCIESDTDDKEIYEMPQGWLEEALSVLGWQEEMPEMDSMKDFRVRCIMMPSSALLNIPVDSPEEDHDEFVDALDVQDDDVSKSAETTTSGPEQNDVEDDENEVFFDCEEPEKVVAPEVIAAPPGGPLFTSPSLVFQGAAPVVKAPEASFAEPAAELPEEKQSKKGQFNHQKRANRAKYDPQNRVNRNKPKK